MKKFIDLVKNESLKLWGQKSFRVLLIIIGVILVLSPLSDLMFSGSLGYEDTSKTHEDYREQADEARAEGDELQAREAEAYCDTLLYFAEKGIEYNSPEYSLYYLEYLNFALTRATLVILSEGEYTPEQLKSSYYLSLDGLYTFLTDYGYYDDMGDNGYLNYNVLDIVKTALAEKSAEEWIKIVDSEFESLRFNIEHFSMKAYYEESRSAAVNYIASLKDLQSQAIEYAKNPGLPESEKIFYQSLLDYYVDTVYCYETYVDALDFIIEKDAAYGSWEYYTVEDIIYNAAYSCEYSMPVTAEEYSASSYRFSYNDFEDYNEAMKDERLLSREALDYSLCSLSNSIPMACASPTLSTKTAVRDQFSSFAGMLAVLFICYAGVMTAHEYSSGTIRLLLIKPRSRRRILCSKFVCIAFWWLVITAGALVVLTVENILFLGVGDLFVPDLKAVGGGIAKIPSFVAILGVFFEEFVIAMLWATFAIFFGVVTKKAVLSVVFPMLVSMGAATAQSISIWLYDSGATFLAYTPFFYLDFSTFHVTAPECFSSLTYTYGTTSIILGRHANIWIGIAMLAVVTLLVVLWAQRVFRKQKI